MSKKVEEGLAYVVFFIVLGLLSGCFPGGKSATPSPTGVAVAHQKPAPVEFQLPTGPLKVVFVGDSFTYRSPGDPASWATRLAKKMGWNQIDYAFGGIGYFEFLKYYEPRIKEDQPDMIFILGGINDRFKADTLEWQGAVRDFYTQLRQDAPRAMIFALSPQWSVAPLPDSVRFMRAVVQTVVRSLPGVCYVDLHDPTFKHPTYVLWDNVHPSDAGEQAYADAVLENVKVCGPIFENGV